MRHAFVLLTLASLNACAYGGVGSWDPTPEETVEATATLFGLLSKSPPTLRLQVQGTVTADDGSLIAGAVVKAEGFCREDCIGTFASTTTDDWRHSLSSCRERCTGTFASTTTDDSGRYSLSFSFSFVTWEKCADGNFLLEAGIEASAEGFLLRLWYLSDPHIRCTEEMQTIDLQLERKSP